MIKGLVQDIKEMWESGSPSPISLLEGVQPKYRIIGSVRRRERTQLVRNSTRLNNSQRNRQTISIKADNNRAKRIYYKNCPDEYSINQNLIYAEDVEVLQIR